MISKRYGKTKMSFAVDSSVLIAYFNGEKAPDIELIIKAASDGKLFLPPVVITEVLSTSEYRKIWGYLEGLPVLPVTEGYWERTADIRRILMEKNLKSHLGDALICQSCLDSNVPLITRDKDFRHYKILAGLTLAKY